MDIPFGWWIVMCIGHIIITFGIDFSKALVFFIIGFLSAHLFIDLIDNYIET
jgi:hypothetical protein